MGPSGHFVLFSDISHRCHLSGFKTKPNSRWNEIHIDPRVSASIEMAVQYYDCRALNKDSRIVPQEKQKVSVVLGDRSDWRTTAEVTFTPYSRQTQLWPMTPSTSCPCPTSTPRRWRSTRCSATATSPGGSAAASWASSKRWGERWREETLLLYFFNVSFCPQIGAALAWGRVLIKRSPCQYKSSLQSQLGAGYLLHQMDRSTARKAKRALMDTSKRRRCHLCKFPSFHNPFSRKESTVTFLKARLAARLVLV